MFFKGLKDLISMVMSMCGFRCFLMGVSIIFFLGCKKNQEQIPKSLIDGEEIKIQKQISESIRNGLRISSIEFSNDFRLNFSNSSSIIIPNSRLTLFSVSKGGNWVVDNIETEISALSTPEDIPTIIVGRNGNWNINEIDLGIKARTRKDLKVIYLIAVFQTPSQLIFYLSDGNRIPVQLDETYPIDESSIYGVRINRNMPFENQIERINNAVGLKQSGQVEGVASPSNYNFATVFPFNLMRVCNIETSLSGVSVTYEKDAGFSRTKDTFVEIPLFFMKRYIKNNYDYRLISKTPHDGYIPAPMFLENDKVLEKVYVAVYETSVNEKGIPQSITGKIPASGKTITEFRNLYFKKGLGFSSLDIRTIMSLQHLYLIYSANKNSQKTIGGGWTDLAQPINKIVNNGVGYSKKVVITASASHMDYHYFIGQAVCTVKGASVVEYTTIANIFKDTPVLGQVTIELADEVNLSDKELTFGSSAQLTGWSDRLTSPTGRSSQKNINPTNQANAVKLFGMENLWGNVWEFVDGFVLKGRTPYIGFDINSYNDQGRGYTALDFQCIEQNTNEPYYGTFGNIENLGMDKKYTWFAFPESLGGSNVSADAGYGDFYYYSGNTFENRYAVFGGGFDHFSRAGIFNIRNWNPLGLKWYLYGSRMQYKNVN